MIHEAKSYPVLVSAGDRLPVRGLSWGFSLLSEIVFWILKKLLRCACNNAGQSREGAYWETYMYIDTAIYGGLRVTFGSLTGIINTAPSGLTQPKEYICSNFRLQLYMFGRFLRPSRISSAHV